MSIYSKHFLIIFFKSKKQLSSATSLPPGKRPWTYHLGDAFHGIKQLLAFESVPVLDNAPTCFLTLTLLPGLMPWLATKSLLGLQ